MRLHITNALRSPPASRECFRGFALTAGLVLALAPAACDADEAATGNPGAVQAVPLSITVSIVPQRYFVDRIGGEHVHVTVMVEPGSSPATYEPKPAQMRALSDAAAYVGIGVPFEEAWLDKIRSGNPGMRMVDTTAGVERRTFPGKPVTDPHIWLSPGRVKIQAQTVADALIAIDPANEADYRANLGALLDDIDALDAGIRQTLEAHSGSRFMVFHPAWGYFASDYGLEMIPIEVGGQEPSAAEMADVISTARAGGIRVVFAQPEFSTQNAETIARQIGGEVLLISPLAPDWLANLHEVAETFARVFGGE